MGKARVHFGPSFTLKLTMSVMPSRPLDCILSTIEMVQIFSVLTALIAVVAASPASNSSGPVKLYGNNCKGSGLCSSGLLDDCKDAIGTVNAGATYSDQAQFSVGHCYMIYATNGAGAQSQLSRDPELPFLRTWMAEIRLNSLGMKIKYYRKGHEDWTSFDATQLGRIQVPNGSGGSRDRTPPNGSALRTVVNPPKGKKFDL
ncbi:hypothetical protein AcV5_008693 [Taiwanofungus camphoratus]|nr:hypothetical protein AcV5_008693 [Antrodia cinnamomea]KAI0956239.1 hypothetical protein AcV7_006689 [Antrodia cinnamomea]